MLFFGGFTHLFLPYFFPVFTEAEQISLLLAFIDKVELRIINKRMKIFNFFMINHSFLLIL